MASLLSLSLPKPSIIRANSSTTATATTTTTLSTPESLDEKFGRKGIKFLESNNIPVVEFTVRNGSSLRLQIPDAHITSYKPKVYWKDDGFEEVLFTVPGTGKESSKAKGGIGLIVNDASEAGSKGSLLSGSGWTVSDVDSDAIDALQVLMLNGSYLIQAIDALLVLKVVLCINQI
uniref:Photosynthetic NDH subunit of subcomplex B 2ic n=1 Tax=Rhizophora mucronata TaxID=61149 RepID=A0A2P2K6Q5_RHIMU